MKINFFFLFFLMAVSCNTTIHSTSPFNNKPIAALDKISLIILGTLQDGGSPHAGCKKDCCKNLFLHPDQDRKVVSLGIVDPGNKKKYIIEASPDLPMQMKNLLSYTVDKTKETPDGIFLTHAHIGHYSGLMYLGKEAMNTNRIDVYAMPRMKQFLSANGPWSQLVNTKNIMLQDLQNGSKIKLSSILTIQPILVPHRYEFSETVGFLIEGPEKKALFIPDIDKWEKWDTNIIDAIAKVDYAFIDATFYDQEEINNRNIKEIPHPFIIESMQLFKDLTPIEKNKVYFIHFNHTNPVLDVTSEQTKNILKSGYHIARINQVFNL